MPGVGEQSTTFLVDMTIYFVMNRNNRLPCPSHAHGSYITTMHVPSQLEFPRYYNSLPFTIAKMLLRSLLSVAILAPIAGLAAPASDVPSDKRGENLCNKYKSPPIICTPDPSVGVEETAQRAYNFYKAFVVDGDAKTMFSLIDSAYIVRYALGY